MPRRAADDGQTPTADAVRVSLVDTHCHLDAKPFSGESAHDVLDRARAAGVDRVVTIGTNADSSREAVRIAGTHEGVWSAVGIDPNDLDDYGDKALRRVDELAASPGVVAIGEIGLDYYWDRAPRDRQLAAFRDQLSLAETHGLPVVIHCRDAIEDTVATLLDWSSGWTSSERPLGVMHCYSGDTATAEALVGAGFLISLAGNVTYKSATTLHEVAAAVPAHALVLETDAPYLSPQPHRGRRNEPARVRVIADFVAARRGVSLEALSAATTANAERLFGWEAGTP